MRQHDLAECSWVRCQRCGKMNKLDEWNMTKEQVEKEKKISLCDACKILLTKKNNFSCVTIQENDKRGES